MFGRRVRLQPMPLQRLSELERVRLQEVAFCHLEDRELDCKITIPQESRKRRKSLRRRLDSFSKEKKERETAPKAFGIPLAQVIANDCAQKQRQDALRESRRDCLELEASVLRFRAEKQHLHGNSKAPSPQSAPPLSPQTPLDKKSRTHRRGGLSVDCISDLVESQSRLLEALQLSHPHELDGRRAAGHAQAKLSLNPIYRQVPRIVERCCRHIEAHGLRTVGIFRVGSSKKRVRQLRESFDMGMDVLLDEDHSVHDVAALLKEFLRDMPDPLLPRELYSAFLHANNLMGAEQLSYLQHLLYLLPPCNCDTLLRLLTLLHTVQSHAHDDIGPDNQEVPGNKMTATNLAVIFGPNLLRRERGSERELSLQAMGAEDSNGIIAVTLLLIQSYQQLFMVSAELQQEVLMSLLQTDPDIIDYLLRRKLSGSHLTVETEIDERRVTKASLDSVGLSSGEQSPLDSPSPMFPDPPGESSFSSKLFLSVLRLNHNSKRPSEDSPRRSIAQIRQFHSHHNLMSLARPPARPHSEDPAQEVGPGEEGGASAERTVLFSLGEDPSTSRTPPHRDSGSGGGKQRTEEKPSSNFWDFFTRKTSSSESFV
ncbi:rho GTPase-activating protein 6-like [Megalops cyprinoides]|uniref:rho GTPase-activating protein 6-like n=1 Tax=Megalops cyprinoides TaxID=118141 RepID=UPI0018643729|nr:rho GTPase-activating protein 6-like [Megalops cyprinoides]